MTKQGKNYKKPPEPVQQGKENGVAGGQRRRLAFDSPSN